MNDMLQTASARTSGTASLRQPDKSRRDDDGEHTSCTEGRVEVTGPVPTAIEHSLRELDAEDAERTDRNPLSAEKQHKQGRLRITPHERERRAKPVLDLVGRRCRKRRNDAPEGC